MDVEDAIDKAVEFLKKKAGYLFPRLIGVNFDKKTKIWTLEFDVGVLEEKIAKVKVDDATGKIVGYERK